MKRRNQLGIEVQKVINKKLIFKNYIYKYNYTYEI